MFASVGKGYSAVLSKKLTYFLEGESLMKMKTKNLTVLGIATLILASTAASVSGVSVSFQEGIGGYAGTDDNQMLDPGTGFQNDNIGARNAIQLGNASSITTRRSILRFDVSSLAGLYSSIDSATITLRKANGPTGGGTDSADMYAMIDANAGWVEGVGNFAPAANDGSSSWVSSADPTAWVGGGGGGTLGALQTSLPGVSGNDPANTFYVFTLDTSLVDHWITTANAGVVIKEGAEIDGAGSGTDLQIEFYSAQFGALADAPVRPKLTINYTEIPEPTTVGLLGLASLLMVGCRRRS